MTSKSRQNSFENSVTYYYDPCTMIVKQGKRLYLATFNKNMATTFSGEKLFHVWCLQIRVLSPQSYQRKLFSVNCLMRSSVVLTQYTSAKDRRTDNAQTQQYTSHHAYALSLCSKNGQFIGLKYVCCFASNSLLQKIQFSRKPALSIITPLLSPMAKQSSSDMLRNLQIIKAKLEDCPNMIIKAI